MKKSVAKRIEFKPIGVILTPFKEVDNMPIQTTGAAGIGGTVEVFPEYADGLKDLEGFSHILLLYHFHGTEEAKLTVTPFLDSEPRGVFATRAPTRPNPIGLSVVRLIRVEGATLHVENVDILDGTPLLDIKPYVPDFDHHPADRTGWLERTKSKVREKRSDRRFVSS
jgi:tRNA-Thr(GGU) m(6)t(6)A37 methyltransferase TsaA